CGHYSGCTRGTSGNHHNFDRLRIGKRSSPAWPRHEPQPAGRQHHGRVRFDCRDWPKAVGIAARASANRGSHGPLVHPTHRALAQAQAREVLSAARNRKLELHVLNARSESDFDAVFADIKRLRVGGLVIGAGSIFISGRKKLADLTIRHAVPAIYLYRDFPVAGGLMSYGSDILDSYRLAGVYTGRVLKGENPAELPVMQATKFELIINLKTAKALGISVPPSMQARADEMIE